MSLEVLTSVVYLTISSVNMAITLKLALSALKKRGKWKKTAVISSDWIILTG